MREQQIQQYFTTRVFLGASYAKRLQRKQPQETHMFVYKNLFLFAHKNSS